MYLLVVTFKFLCLPEARNIGSNPCFQCLMVVQQFLLKWLVNYKYFRSFLPPLKNWKTDQKQRPNVYLKHEERRGQGRIIQFYLSSRVNCRQTKERIKSKNKSGFCVQKTQGSHEESQQWVPPGVWPPFCQPHLMGAPKKFQLWGLRTTRDHAGVL